MPDTLMLVGGPQDGRVLIVESVPHDFRIPTPPTINLEEPDDFKPDLSYGEYLPRTDQHGHISRNDSGELIYDWQGIR